MDGLLQAILEEPDSDDLRLIYADWLEDHGEPERAEFIRVQCRLATLNAELLSEEDCEYPSCPGCIERRELRRREQVLLEENCFHWSMPINPFLVSAHVTWRRGFMDVVSTDCAAWLAHGSELVRCHPIQRVRLSDKEPMQLSALSNDMPTVWHWFPSDSAVAERHRLPGDIYFSLPIGFRVNGWLSVEHLWEKTSNACLAWAKQQQLRQEVCHA